MKVGMPSGKTASCFNRPFPRYGWFGKHRAKVACTYQSLAFNLNKTCSQEIDTIDSMIVLPFPSSVSISNQSIVSRNYIENEALISRVDFRVQSAVSWERSMKGVFAWRRASPLGRFHLPFTWEKPALLPGLTTFIFRRNPESDICVQVFIL